MKNLIYLCGILFLFMILLGIFNNACSQQYEWNKGKYLGLGLTVAGGFIDGAVEGYEFDGRTSFERKWGVEEYSFFGSKSWDMPMNGWERQFGKFDFYHVADDLRKVSYISGGIVIGLSGAKLEQKWFHYFYDFLITFAASGISKWAGMYYVRHIDNW